MSFRILSRSEFSGCKRRWNNLVSSSSWSEPFATHEWLSLWLRCYADSEVLVPVIETSVGRLEAGIPFLRDSQKRFGVQVNVLRFCTSGITPRFAPLIRRGRVDVLQRLLAEIVQIPGCNFIRLENVPLEELQAVNFEEALGDLRYLILPGRLSPFIRTDNNCR